MSDVVLTLNAGSSSVKFGIYEAAGGKTVALLDGQVERIGADASLVVGEDSAPIDAPDHAAALAAIIAAVRTRVGAREVGGVGHRVVHGGPHHDRPALLDEATIAGLEALASLAPLHQPHNLAGIYAARAAFPGVAQVACFDTAFHRGQPWVEDAYALLGRYFDEGVRRYGFHGLSYDYVTGWLAENEPALHAGRTVIAHLGNGASMCALAGGRSVASTMGFSVLDGLAMGTRCGQLDPGVVLHLIERGGEGGAPMSVAEVTAMLYRQSGLRALSGGEGGADGTNDMRELLAREARGDEAAGRAVDYFTHRIAREVGSLAAAMGGLDGVVFTGGIGENAAPVRARALAPLAFLRLSVDEGRNARGARDIGAGTARVLVVPTDEERIIARAVARLR